MVDSEVIIVGGGPAGATCARKLRKAGIPAVILEREPFPRRKICAGWITPRVVKVLGLADRYPGTLTAFRRFHYYICGRKIAVPTRQYAIRRIELDHWLVERASVPLYRHTVERVEREGDSYVIDGAFRCRYLVGAGGTSCPVYRAFFSAVRPREKNRLIATLNEEIRYEWRDGDCHFWFFPRGLPGYCWYIPKEGGYLNVGVGAKVKGLKRRGETLRECWDEFVSRLEEKGMVPERSWKPKGYGYYLRQGARRARAGNAFVVGDAAGLATGDMGEGIGPAVESGLLAARAIAAGASYHPHRVRRYSLVSIMGGRLGLSRR